MRLNEYAAVIGGLSAVAEGTGIPISTLHRIATGKVRCRIDNAQTIVEFSRQNPAPSGETVRYEDLVPDEVVAA